MLTTSKISDTVRKWVNDKNIAATEDDIEDLVKRLAERVHEIAKQSHQKGLEE